MGGDAPEIIESDILDAEFEVQPNNAAADSGAIGAQSTPGPESTAAPNSAASAPASPETTGAAAGTAPPASAAPVAGDQQPATTTQLQTDPTTPSEEKKALLVELKGLIQAGAVSREQYVKVLDSKGVKSAHDLDVERLAHMVDGLKKRLAKKQAAEGKDELSTWANNVLAGTPGN
jgi:hypothetical protein